MTGMFHIRGRRTYSPISIHAPKVSDNEKVWTVLKGDTIGNLVVGEKIERLKFGNMTLYGVMVVSLDSDDVYECEIDHFIVEK